MKTAKSFLSVLVCVAAIGCGGPETGKLDEDYMKQGPEIGRQRREIFVRANGNYDSLSSEDKAAYLKSFGGNETNARNFWEMMKNPPTSSGPLVPSQQPK